MSRLLPVLLLVLLLLGARTLRAQPDAQATTAALTGRISDADSDRPLHGAHVLLWVGDTLIGATTDTAGIYRFAAVPTGIHTVEARAMGYWTDLAREVWVRAGREERVDLALRRHPNELVMVEVYGAAPQRLLPLGTVPLTVEQSLRYPATFFDPARLAMSHAGVSSTNDQANHLSIRGNGPAVNAWLLEGAEIVNPNHLTNAGTATDRPTLSGGGTTILSAQLLGTSRLLLGGFGAQYGNALGGIMDLRLRPGTTARPSFTAQAGLIGIDLAAEGPFRKGGKASYLINYRYSTLGLLSAMGVALGDEAITFQDIAFHLNLPLGARTQLTIFGMGGSSSNRFAAKDSTEWEVDKDSQNIDYTGLVGVAGLTLRQAVGANAVWRTTAVISRNQQERVEEGPFFARRGARFTVRNALAEQKLAVHSYLRGKWSPRTAYQVGANILERKVEKDDLFSENVVGWLLRPYAELDHAITDRLRAELGLGWSYYTPNGSEVLEPRLALRYGLRKGRSISLAAGQRGMLPQVQSFPVRGFGIIPDNRNVGITRAQDLVLAYDHPFNPQVVLHAEAFVQRQVHVPVGDRSGFSAGSLSTLSMVNVWNELYYTLYAGLGEATNAGLELGLAHGFHRGLFYQVNATLLDARYTDFSGREHNSRWNTGGMGNVVLGREWEKQGADAKRTWGVNGRVNVSGGQRYTPVPDNPGVVPGSFSAQNATYHRVDLRVYRKREHKERTGMWSLDLLNVLNTQNEAFRYYDYRQRQVLTQYQLGLIPNLSYRVEF